MSPESSRQDRRNRALRYFIGGLFGVMVLWIIVTVVVVLFGNNTLGLRMVNVSASMFAGVLGLGTGYRLGLDAGPSEDG